MLTDIEKHVVNISLLNYIVAKVRIKRLRLIGELQWQIYQESDNIITNNKFSKDLGHLVRVFLKNFFKTFLGRKHIVFAWPKREAKLKVNGWRPLTTSPNQSSSRHSRMRASDRKPGVCGETSLNYLATGNTEMIRCSVIFPVRELINKYWVSRFLLRANEVLSRFRGLI